MYRTVFWTLLGGGVIWENGIETCIVSYEKRVASLDLMQNTVYMYHNFLIHSFANGHLGFFHVLAIVNSSEVDIKVHVSSVAQMVKRLSTMRETRVWSLGWEDPLEKEMATHYSTIGWKIPWTEEPGKLQFMGSQRVRHDWATSRSRSRSQEAWGWCTGITQRGGMGREVGWGGSGLGTCVHLWQIHVDVWQNQYNIVK